MRFSYKIFGSVLVASAALAAGAEIIDRPTGYKIGSRMTLKPYVSVSTSYDSNPRSRNDCEDGDVMWTVSPGMGLTYNAETWSLLLSGYYNYRQYCKSENEYLNRHSYGESLRWNWSSSTGAEKGWSLLLSESFQQITASDDMTLGRQSYTQDSRQLQVTGVLQRRFNEQLHADLNSSYYWLEYLNDVNSRNAMYGWDRWTVGGDMGYAVSKWTDLLVTGSYQGYTSKNAEGSSTIGSTSQGYTVQAGIGSYMTERISYRALGGWYCFDYGDGASKQDGFAYTVSGNWKIGETWNTMLLASSYYQPSERQYSSSSRVDAFSWGLSKLLIRGKLRANLDVQYQRDTHSYVGSDINNNDFTVNRLTGRLGLDYNLNRFLALFVNGEFQQSWNDESSRRGGAYDYDRWRVTTGIRLQY